MGRMTSHILWKLKNVPNHQPATFRSPCQISAQGPGTVSVSQAAPSECPDHTRCLFVYIVPPGFWPGTVPPGVVPLCPLYDGTRVTVQHRATCLYNWSMYIYVLC
jgi:hypothetical protein